MARLGRYALLVLASLPVFAAGTEIADPVNFVSDVYKNYMASRKAKPYLPPQDIYTPRLKRLLDEDRRKAKGEVGCIDFDFWVNGQDWRLSKLQVVSGKAPSGPDRQVVVATFVSLGSAEEIHFDFERIRGKWLLDDVHSIKGMPWTLSKLLSCWPQ